MFYTRVDLCILLAVLPTWHKTNINLSFSSNAEADDFNFIGLLNTIFQFLCRLFRPPFFIVDFFVDRAKCPCLTAVSCNIATEYLNFALQRQHFDIFLSYQWNVLPSGMFFFSGYRGWHQCKNLTYSSIMDMLIHTLKYTSHIVIWYT